MEPLAARLRPQTLDEVVGQEHLVGAGKPLRVAIEKKHLFSFILWGPPGSGKTTIARIYARALDAELHELSAVSAGKEDIRKIISKNEKSGDLVPYKPHVLFLDEIHRFNKAQQDFLLPYVESGELTLIGATTENPSFEVVLALLSRCRVFVLEPLSEEALNTIVKSTKLKVNKDAGVAYLAGAKKDRSSYDAYSAALADVKKLGNLPIPKKVRNAPAKLMKDLDYHKGCKLYDEESYLPDKLKKKGY